MDVKFIMYYEVENIYFDFFCDSLFFVYKIKDKIYFKLVC